MRGIERKMENFFIKKKKLDRKKKLEKERNSKEEGEEEWERGRERKSLGWGRTLKNERWERERKSGREGELEGED
jgi:hypothetical protein